MTASTITKRVYYAIPVILQSPLCIVGGEVYTDADVLVNGSNEYFIPGTSVAGACRNYIEGKKNIHGLFGYAEGEKGRMSSVYFSDVILHHTVASVRDGVALDEEKIVSNKFDMEIIEAGAEGTLFISWIERANDQKNDYEQMLWTVLYGMQSGEIRLGSNKNRGFGRLKINNVFKKSFDASSVEEWLAFMPYEKDTSCYDQVMDFKSLIEQAKNQKYIKISVPLKQRGGISIRKYSARPDEADYEHITSSGKSVIPGTSWNGAIRGDARRILNSIKKKQPLFKGLDTNQVIDDWFGSITDKDGQGHQSRIVISESVIENCQRLRMTRNRINRFDASTQNGALYTEISSFNGDTVLEMFVRKDDKQEYLAVIGLLKIVIEDIRKGYLAVGGGTAIGRGLFEINGEVKYYEPIEDGICEQALYAYAAEKGDIEK